MHFIPRLLSVLTFAFLLLGNNFCKSKKVNQENLSLDTKKSNAGTGPISDPIYGKLSNLLKMEDLQNASIEVEIRIWYLFNAYDSGRVVQFQKRSNKWTSTAHYFKMNFDSSHQLYSIVSMRCQNEPLNDWVNFLKNIEAYRIYDLKDYSQIRNYDYGLGTGFLLLEVKKNGNYRKISYPTYSLNESRIPDVQQLLSIMFLIQREFGYTFFETEKLNVTQGYREFKFE